MHVFMIVSGGVLLVIILSPVVFYLRSQKKMEKVVRKWEDGKGHIHNAPDPNPRRPWVFWE